MRVGAESGVRRLIILGSTGSIGVQTLEVVTHLNSLHARGEFPFRFEVVGLAAGRNADATLAQAMTHGVREVALADGKSCERVSAPPGVKVRSGADAAERLVREVECDMVVGAIVGAAGLSATLAAVERGTDVALANKETLVAAGSIVIETARKSGARLLPVDSEHSGVWQALAGATEKAHVAEALGTGHRALDASQGVARRPQASRLERQAALVPPCEVGADVSRVILTASGGALRNKTKEQVENATPEDALAHPTWNMGAKVTIDTASLTNKALEVIEAHWLFGLEADRIGVVVHPQSIIHAVVEFADGSSIAQMGVPTMCTPIQVAIAYPHRVSGKLGAVSLASASRLDFIEPDLGRFPALELGFRVAREGGTSGAVFNAANEAAVEAFLARKIPFGKIARLSRAAMDEIGVSEVRSLDDVYAADREARRFVGKALGIGH
ncbi:MAG TPA: 1-deoxy-D-xylulose-5-phosphate reductoisomerase [Phycisphaerales bacterium]|nr:1-deoxy-D-xylulose-5-phosphate reductoisomerase [Phycisphaerales bacterium]